MPVDPRGPRWKSSYSGGGTSDSRVEVANLRAGYAVRDAKNRSGGMLTVPAASWSPFPNSVR